MTISPPRALCADKAFDPTWWDPGSTEHTVAAQVCRQCPLAASCRDEAIRTSASGVFGGRLFRNGTPGERLRSPNQPAARRRNGRSFDDPVDPRAIYAQFVARWAEPDIVLHGRRALLTESARQHWAAA